MTTARKLRHSAVSILTLMSIGTFVPAAFSQQASLGKVDFPTSGPPQAQAHFLRGVAALHSFWFEEALDAFRESTKIDPEFMMGYWGEAMAYNHPLWAQQDTEAARKVIEKIHDTAKLTPRERAYLNAVRALYTGGDKLTRDIAYSKAMEKVYQDYPDDLEAACFYALSLLGTVRPGDKGFRRQMQAGAIALNVYQKNPNHPGAAHYIIHAFDDPEHAILALPAARRYAEIAPEAHHARHMPSHIFVQLGMWPEAAGSNEASWAASDAWVKRKGLSISLRDYHSLHWLLYIYCQQGRYSKAEGLLSLMQRSMEQAPQDSGMKRSFSHMAAALVVETGRWDLASKVFSTPTENGASRASEAAGGGEHSGHGAAGQGYSTAGITVYPTFIAGLAEAEQSRASAEKSATEMGRIRDQIESGGDHYRARMASIMELEVRALLAAKKGDYNAAIELMKKATAAEADLSPPSGPPELIKPSHELFGELLLAAGQPKEAFAQFATSLSRQPNRARSLLGSARASAKSGDTQAASAAYSEFLKIWKEADQDRAEIQEAHSYLQQASTR